MIVYSHSLFPLQPTTFKHSNLRIGVRNLISFFKFCLHFKRRNSTLNVHSLGRRSKLTDDNQFGRNEDAASPFVLLDEQPHSKPESSNASSDSNLSKAIENLDPPLPPFRSVSMRSVLDAVPSMHCNNSLNFCRVLITIVFISTLFSRSVDLISLLLPFSSRSPLGLFSVSFWSPPVLSYLATSFFYTADHSPTFHRLHTRYRNRLSFAPPANLLHDHRDIKMTLSQNYYLSGQLHRVNIGELAANPCTVFEILPKLSLPLKYCRKRHLTIFAHHLLWSFSMTIFYDHFLSDHLPWPFSL